MKISVISTTYNSEKYLVENLKALKSQTYQNYEHIIFDSCSTDNTVKILKKFQDHRTKLFVEKDNGIFFGLNKCLDNVTGDLIFLYCSDDTIKNKNLFYEISKVYESRSDVISTDVNIVSEKTNNIVRRWEAPKKLSHIILPAHTGLFIGSYFKKFNFDTKYKISSDFKYLRKIFKDNNINYKFLNIHSVDQRDGGNSTKYSNQLKKMTEDIKILNEDSLFSIFLYPIKIIYKLTQFRWKIK